MKKSIYTSAKRIATKAIVPVCAVFMAASCMTSCHIWHRHHHHPPMHDHRPGPGGPGGPGHGKPAPGRHGGPGHVRMIDMNETDSHTLGLHRQ